MKNVKPIAGQVWECHKKLIHDLWPGSKVTIIEIISETAGWYQRVSLADERERLRITSFKEFVKHFKFIPQTDLEWLAVNVNGVDVRAFYAKDLSSRDGYKVNGKNLILNYGGKLVQGKRYELGLDEKPLTKDEWIDIHDSGMSYSGKIPISGLYINLDDGTTFSIPPTDFPAESTSRDEWIDALPTDSIPEIMSRVQVEYWKTESGAIINGGLNKIISGTVKDGELVVAYKIKKETKMIDLRVAKVGDGYEDEKGNVFEIIATGLVNIVVKSPHDGGFFVVSRDGSFLMLSSLRLVKKHVPRPWLKDLPGADLFNGEWLAYNNNGWWNVFNAEPVISHAYYACQVNGKYHPLNGVKMPTLTGDEWKDSKISIPDLKAWQEANK